MKDEIIKDIHKLCTSTTFGCQDVILYKITIRPTCIEELWLCKDRKNISIIEAKLIEKIFLKAEFKNYMHQWPKNPWDFYDEHRNNVVTMLGDIV